MNADALKLTTYFGERDRVGGGFAADAFTAVYARHELRMSLLMRGVEGFGAHQHQLRTDRLLTLSEDLPLVSVAVDTRAADRGGGGGARRDARSRGSSRWSARGWCATRRPRSGSPTTWARRRSSPSIVGRHERAAGRPAHEAVVGVLHRHGVAGATVLLGVDGTAARAPPPRALLRRATRDVPLMVIAVGTARASPPRSPSSTRCWRGRS